MKRLRELGDVTGPARLPGYRPEAHGRGILHLGLGAFHRAHQAAYTDAALAQAGGDWRITGVSLRSAEMGAALKAQNGLYTLIENAPEGPKAQVIGAIRDVISADPKATLAAMQDRAVKIVSLSVTEKGYGIDRAAMAPDQNHPAVAQDLLQPRHPVGVLGLITEALRLRRAAGVPPFTLLSCDNLPENGALLRAGVIGFARQESAEFADWIAAEVAFPSSMVDRITPAATAETLAEAARQTGCEDRAAIAAEPFSQWVIEDHFPQGRPAWEAGGAQFVKNVQPYEQMKLTMLNGSHSMIAYAGCLLGHGFVRDVMADRLLLPLVRRHLRAAAATLPKTEGMDLASYAQALEERFRNPAIAHATNQIAMDGSQKLPQRLFSPALAALALGQSPEAFAFATALWLAYVQRERRAGKTLNDPRGAEIYAALAPAAATPAAMIAAINTLPNLVPQQLAQNALWQMALQERLGRLLQDPLAAIAAEQA